MSNVQPPSADLAKASSALQSIKQKPELLEELDLALTKFRHGLGEDLNDATYTYVLNALLNQRVIDGVDRYSNSDGVTKMASGFRVIAAVSLA